MSWIDDIFGAHKTQDSASTTSGTSSGTGTSAQTGAQTGTVDPRLKAFADWAAGQAQTAYQPAQGLVQGAAAPTTFGQVSSLLNPYAASQVQANFTSLQPQFQDQLSQLKGSQSGNPYASSNGGAEARLRGQFGNTLGQISSGIYGQSYGQALGATQADLARQLQAGQASGALSTQQLGQVIPSVIGAGGQSTYGTSNQTGNTAYTGQQQGTTTGHSTTTSTDSPFDIGTDLAAGAMKLPFSDERVKSNIERVGKTDDGQPIYTYNKFGSPFKEMGLLAQDVERKHPHAVGEISGIKTVDLDAATKGAKRKASNGGEIGNTFADSVRKHFHAFHSMRKHAESGGAAEGYDWGGTVTMEPDTAGDAIVNQANYNQGRMDATPSLGSSGFYDWLGSHRQKSQPAPAAKPPAEPDILGQQQGALTAFLSRMPKPMASGGDPLSDDDTSPAARAFFDAPLPANEPEMLAPRKLVGQPYAPMKDEPSYVGRNVPSVATASPPPSGGWLSGLFGSPRQSGVMVGEGQLTPSDRAATILSSMGRGRVAKGILGLQEADLARAKETGLLGDTATLPMQQFEATQARNARLDPVNIAHIQSQTKLAEVQADKEYQLELAKQKAAYEKELARADWEAKMDQFFKFNKRMADEQDKTKAPARPNARYEWLPQTEAAPPAAPAPPAPPVVAPAPAAVPPALGASRSGALKGSIQNPYPSASGTRYGDHFVGSDQKTIYRNNSTNRNSNAYEPVGRLP